MKEKRILTSLILVFLSMVTFAQTDFYATDSIGCAPFTVKFSLDYTTIDTTTATSVIWNFGNGTTSSDFDPDSVYYEDPGTYTVTIIVDENTTNPTTKTDYIEVGRMVEADFLYETTDEDLEYVFTPENSISDADAEYYYTWLYTNQSDSQLRNITDTISYGNDAAAIDTFLFSDYGTYLVRLTITDSYGCADSTENNIYLFQSGESEDGFVVGNVYAPNSSDQDYFIIKADDSSVILSFKLFSRTGVLLYSSESQVIYWDGRTNYGRELPTGVYYYVLEALQGDDTGYYSKSGFIHLFR